MPTPPFLLQCPPNHFSPSPSSSPTPGQEYEGEWFEKWNCAVSILRSGTATSTHSLIDK